MAWLKSPRPVLIFFSLAALCWLPGAARPQSPSADGDPLAEGRRLFVRHCAPCHGPDGKGNGPAAASLKTPPPDLTAIQRPGTRFPAGRVMDFVEGAKVVNAHGSRTMPVWGKVLTNEKGYSKAQADLHSLVRYLESIQTHRDLN